MASKPILSYPALTTRIRPASSEFLPAPKVNKPASEQTRSVFSNPGGSVVEGMIVRQAEAMRVAVGQAIDAIAGRPNNGPVLTMGLGRSISGHSRFNTERSALAKFLQ